MPAPAWARAKGRRPRWGSDMARRCFDPLPAEIVNGRYLIDVEAAEVWLERQSARVRMNVAELVDGIVAELVELEHEEQAEVDRGQEGRTDRPGSGAQQLSYGRK